MFLTFFFETKILLGTRFNKCLYDCVLTEKKAREEEDKDRMRLEDMSEDEYDALPDKDKAAVDMKRLEIKKERIRK